MLGRMRRRLALHAKIRAARRLPDGQVLLLDLRAELLERLSAGLPPLTVRP